ncbi:UNVERIFIED_CONTAM: Aldehyde dehydrogenase family 7 member A1 [Trichonephila clavipes]
MTSKELKALGLADENLGTSTGSKWFSKGETISSYSPTNGKLIGKVQSTTKKEYDKVIQEAEKAKLIWRDIPAPKRGEMVRQLGEKLRELKPVLGKLVSYEMGKSYQEGLGEVQEMIDICDFAVGLSRQLYGNTIHSERPGHRMYDQYHPLGIVGIISAFNFPVAVWSWNAALALVCGDVIVWKGSEKTPLCALACQKILATILKENKMPEGISSVITGGAEVKKSLVDAYKQIKIGDPLDSNNHMGPLIDTDAVDMYLSAVEKIKAEGGKLLTKAEVLKGKGYESGCYVTPVIAEVENNYEIVQHETFAPILYLIKYTGEVDQAIAIQNDVRQGLSSALMTNSLREAEMFLSQNGSDCGIANVNIGTSGAEIGGAFGGEKETGGGRESGSDAWKVYMRRQTNTINYTTNLPLAQGIKFDL